ncbi:hypothetical protein [Aliiroseovarius sp. YM-037]|uniref:hypothetical protein n=1 Tax=Aliiroseovarius sp. YM-037 TaxID=3341728 RepID=UPI003A812366
MIDRRISQIEYSQDQTMKAYLSAHLLLAPYLVFTILAPIGYPLIGAARVVAVGIILVVLLLVPSFKETNALAIVFAFLTGGAVIRMMQTIRGQPSF